MSIAPISIAMETNVCVFWDIGTDSPAVLLGWIKSPYGEEQKVPSSAVDDASMYIGVARRNSSLGMARPNTQKRVADAKRALSAAMAEDLEQTETERMAVETAHAAFMESMETKEGIDADERSAAIADAKQALDVAMGNFTGKPAARMEDIERLRVELRHAEEANRNAPDEDEPRQGEA